MRILSGIGHFFTALAGRAVRLALLSALAGAVMLVLDVLLLRDTRRDEGRP